LEEPSAEPTSADEMQALIKKLEQQMREAAKRFEFEKAAGLRDRVKALREKEVGLAEVRSQEPEVRSQEPGTVPSA